MCLVGILGAPIYQLFILWKGCSCIAFLPSILANLLTFGYSLNGSSLFAIFILQLFKYFLTLSLD